MMQSEKLIPMNASRDSTSSTDSNTSPSLASVDPNQPLPLQYEWVFSYDDGCKKGANQVDYESSLKSLGSFNTVQDFWRYWNNLIDNTKPLPESSNLRMFKQGITPSWEHPANAQGGKWILQCQKDQTKRYFTSLVLSLIGDCLSFCDEVCGIVLSTRTTTDSISLWNTNAENSTLIEKYTSEISELLSLHSNPNVSLEYKPHQASLDFNKSYQPGPGRRSLPFVRRRSSATLSTSSTSSPRRKLDSSSSDNLFEPEKSPRNKPVITPTLDLHRSYSLPAIHERGTRRPSPSPRSNSPMDTENKKNQLQSSGKKRRHNRRKSSNCSTIDISANVNSTPNEPTKVATGDIESSVAETVTEGVVDNSEIHTTKTSPLISIGAYSTVLCLKKAKSKSLSILEITTWTVLLLSLALGLAYLIFVGNKDISSRLVRLF